MCFYLCFQKKNTIFPCFFQKSRIFATLKFFLRHEDAAKHAAFFVATTY